MYLRKRKEGGRISGFNFFGADMSATKPSPKGKPRRNSQASVDEFIRLTGALKGAFPDESRTDSPIKIAADEFVVYRRGDRAAFAKLMRNHKPPPLLKEGQLDILADLRSARDGNSSY